MPPPARTRRLTVGVTWDGERSLPADERVEVVVREAEGGVFVEVDAPFHGDPAPPTAAGPTDRLWTFEAVELFLAGGGEGPFLYTEIEMGPHGHHLVLRFLGRRNPLDRALPLPYRAELGRGERWRGLAFVPASLLPAPPLRGAAFAVWGPAARRRFASSIPLPGPAPDFHRPDRFPILFGEDA